MPAKSNPTDILLAHNRWANDNLLAACAALTDEQLQQPFEMGLGSLYKTLAHILGATRGWTDALAQRDQRPRLESESHSVAELIEMHPDIADDFESTLRARPLDTVMKGVRAGQSYAFTHGGVLTHVTTHAMHHRAQALNMLRHLGVDPLPPVSVLEWMLMADEPAA